MTFAPLCIGSLKASRLGLGTWALGGGNDWGPASREDGLNAVAAALDAGVNLIDTSPVYGAGAAEELLGGALKGRRQQVILATKCGISLCGGRPDHDLRPGRILAECDASLKRLQTDYIDLYQIHWPDPKVPLADALDALMRLKQQGKIRALGVCNFGAELLAEACALAPVVSVQNPLSLLDHKQQAVLKFCREKGISFVAYGALGGGILSGKYKKEPNFRRCDARRYFYKYYFGADFAAASSAAARVKELAGRKNIPPSAAALAWVLAQEGVSCALFGARSAAQARENMTAAELSERDREFLQHG